MSVDPNNYILFWKAIGYYGVFCQWFDSLFTYDGMQFTTAEQFMMYRKAEFFGDNKLRKLILSTPEKHPSYHKTLGKQVCGFNQPDWSTVRLQVAVAGNMLKFTQNPRLAQILIETKDKILVEASPYDRIWGIGFDSATALLHLDNWGSNELGSALMQVRRMLTQSAIVPTTLKTSDGTGSSTSAVLHCSEPRRITFRRRWEQSKPNF